MNLLARRTDEFTMTRTLTAYTNQGPAFPFLRLLATIPREIRASAGTGVIYLFIIFLGGGIFFIIIFLSRARGDSVLGF